MGFFLIYPEFVPFGVNLTRFCPKSVTPEGGHGRVVAKLACWGSSGELHELLSFSLLATVLSSIYFYSVALAYLLITAMSAGFTFSCLPGKLKTLEKI